MNPIEHPNLLTLFDTWWQTLTGVQVVLIVYVVTALAFVFCFPAIVRRADGAEDFDRELENVVRDSVAAAHRARLRAEALRSADVPEVERRPMWGEVSR